MSRQSLGEAHPGRPDIPVLAVLALATLATGLLLPILNLEKVIFWDKDYSIITGTVGLFEEGEIFIAILLTLLVILIPLARLVAVVLLWFTKLSAEGRTKALSWLAVLDKWSMVDVFFLAAIVVFIQLADEMNAQARIGTWFFGAGVFLSSLTAWRVNRLAR